MTNNNSPERITEIAMGLLLAGLGIIGIVVHKGILTPVPIVLLTFAYILLREE